MLTYDYDGVNDFILYGYATAGMPLGTLVASDYIENDIHYLEVKITFNNKDYLFKNSHLYVGTKSGYETYLGDLGGIMETDYANFPFLMRN